MERDVDRGPLVLRLDLDAGGPTTAEVEATLAHCTALGLRFFTLAEAGDTVESRARVYQLVREGVVDDPGGDGTFLSLEAFSEQLFEPYYWRWAACQFIAAAGDDWVGLTNLQLRDTGPEFGVTVVKRAYRQQGVARALKSLALAYLRDRGASSVVTRNDPRNGAMLRLNRRLGFEVEV